MSIDSVANFLTIIRNGVARSKSFVTSPYSRLNMALLDILKDEGFIIDFACVQNGAHQAINVYLKYVDGESVIHAIDRVSSPGRRCYVRINATGKNSLKPVIDGLGVSILTTSHGIVSHKKAKELGIGGEVICTVW